MVSWDLEVHLHPAQTHASHSAITISDVLTSTIHSLSSDSFWGTPAILKRFPESWYLQEWMQELDRIGSFIFFPHATDSQLGESLANEWDEPNHGEQQQHLLMFIPQKMFYAWETMRSLMDPSTVVRQVAV